MREMLAKCMSLIGALVLALAVAVGASGNADAPSGLRGVVTRSPVTPVCMQGVPCSAPAKYIRLVFSRLGRSVATRTDAAGRYRVRLFPGTWTVGTSAAPRIGSGISPRTVRVLAARFRKVDFDIDTGIR